jgi:hypothetical protein
MSFEDYKLFAYISTASVLVPLVLGLVRLKQIQPELKLLFILTGVSLVGDLASLLLHYVQISSNYAGNTYTLFEFEILLAIFYLAFKKPGLRGVFVTLGLVYFLFSFLNLLFFQKQNVNSYSLILSSMVMIVLAVVFFYRLIVDLPALQIHQLPLFWINVAVLVFFSGNLFLFILSHYLVNTLNDNLILYWSFHNLLTIIRNLLFAIAFYRGVSPARNLS